VISFALRNFITRPACTVPSCTKTFFGSFTSDLKEPEPEPLLEALKNDDVLSIDRVRGLSPLAFFIHRERREHALHRRDLRTPPLSIGHLHQSTRSGVRLFRGFTPAS
jgi:hypothetical protein